MQRNREWVSRTLLCLGDPAAFPFVNGLVVNVSALGQSLKTSAFDSGRLVAFRGWNDTRTAEGVAFFGARGPVWLALGRRDGGHSDGLNVSAWWPMTQEQDTVVERAYREFWDAKEALQALEAACVEISESSSITTEEGYLMLAPSGIRLLDTEYVRKVVAEYRAARLHVGALRKRLMDLGEPDPE